MRPEAKLQKEIRISLAERKRVGGPRVHVVSNFVGSVISWALVARVIRSGDLDELRRTHPVQAGLGTGSSDLVGMIRGSGRVFVLEIKMPGEKPRPDQVAWLSLVRRWGGFACVVRSPEEALAAVDRACRGESE